LLSPVIPPVPFFKLRGVPSSQSVLLQASLYRPTPPPASAFLLLDLIPGLAGEETVPLWGFRAREVFFRFFPPIGCPYAFLPHAAVSIVLDYGVPGFPSEPSEAFSAAPRFRPRLCSLSSIAPPLTADLFKSTFQQDIHPATPPSFVSPVFLPNHRKIFFLIVFPPVRWAGFFYFPHILGALAPV